MAWTTSRAMACAVLAAAVGAAAFGRGAAVGADTENAYDAGVRAAATQGRSGLATTTAPTSVSSIAACAKVANGQLRLADEHGCNPSEVSVTLAAGDQTPLEVTRLLTIPPGAGGQFVGIFGGLICPANRTIVSGGFQLLRDDLKITDSFVGPAFGLPRVYFAQVRTVANQLLPEGDAARMWAKDRKSVV